MISIEEAREIIQNQQFEASSKIKNIADITKNDVLAKDLNAPVDLPLFSNSMMDGYVVGGVSDNYCVVGDIQAGDTKQYNLRDGEAYRIFTGAPTPANAFAVIMQELAERNADSVSFKDEIIEGKNIRVKGDEVQKGQLVLPKGTVLTPGVIGLLASMGITTCEVYTKPVITILSTGDECKPADAILEFGQIYESNGIMLQKALEENGFDVKERAHVLDFYEITKVQIDGLLKTSDVLIVTGGISVGDHDHVGKCIRDLGVQQQIYQIRQKPGKPFYFGRLGNKAILALPGNPASSLTCLYQYGIPVIKLLSGIKNDEIFPVEIKMILSHQHIKKSDRPEFLRSHYHYTDSKVDILTKQRSSMLHSYALANCLVFLQEGIYELEAGSTVTGYLI